MAKFLKFNKAATSTNDADEFYMVAADDIKYIETAATSVVVYVLGRGANAAYDTVTITCTAGDESAWADAIALAAATNRSQIVTIDVSCAKGCSAIAYGIV